LLVDGVSCLGRCDRAPAVRVSVRTDGPCPHEFFYLTSEPGAGAKSADRFAGIVKSALRERKLPRPDLDAARKLEPPPSTWVIDPYPDEESQYGAVREFIRTMRDLKEDDGKWKPEVLKDPFQHLPILRDLLEAGLIGMGGAGGRTYKKWSDVLLNEGEVKYVVCNADESEPSTFKDRELLIHKPHLVLEGMILAGLVVGAEEGILYLRHEYPEQEFRVNQEIARIERLRLCGQSVEGWPHRFVLRCFVSPGGYICGEQSALIEAIEDKRAEPRNRPPELEKAGLHDRPTVVNNVETLAWAPLIAIKHGDGYREAASGRGRGLRLLSICGDVKRPGVYEVPVGVTFAELIDRDDYCQGMAPGMELLAIAPAGPSGGLLPAFLPVSGLKVGEDRLELHAHIKKMIDRSKSPRPGPPPRNQREALEQKMAPIAGAAESKIWEKFLADAFPNGPGEWETKHIPIDVGLLRSLKVAAGAGITIIGTREKDPAKRRKQVLDLAVVATKFFAGESCGKCVPCRLGSQQLVRIGEGLQAGDPPSKHAATVSELDTLMEMTSICGLGKVAANPLETLFAYFLTPPVASGAGS
ncbi:MAG TPA: NADH-ubiquinone oxidoreductase-F iron-sulfur binding region domain-containing protein, partial [Planctomycetia bacterium]|nr:NADH-ubiquinone oxidoreductase-F iron-sulfur binding region domain-containing protein [Planctomycetia bacterium]